MARRGIAPHHMRAGRLVRPARFSLCAAALAAAAALLPAPEAAAARSTSELEQPLGGQSTADFYAARDGQPLWLGEDGSAGGSATLLLNYLRTADADGLDPGHYPISQLENALRSAWGGSPARLRQADRLL